MKYLTSNEIRNIWLSFFQSKGHHVEEGASLIPVNDPTLLWINAGVAALKKYFDGSVIPNNPRICNVQKAIRTNDIENVGHTARHHTFFEMMGNFSIGDYFKYEAIEFAFELLTSEQYFAIPLEKMYITYFPEDKDTLEKWLSLGVKKDHMIPCLDNFWEIGEGPCGPDSEIFFDRGENYDPEKIGIDLLKKDIENDRYIEIWNIVFSQYNSKPGIPRSEYQELPHKNIDTGAGLERFCLIMQNAETNYETDLFMPIIRKCETLSKFKYESDYKVSYKIIADHIRTCTFALADGASFSNEGRGYVLRRLLRRAVRHGRKLGINQEFLSILVDEVIEIMKDFYPYLMEKASYIKNLVALEERKFLDKLTDGERILNDLYERNHAITGEDAFLLYDTYGYPFEITLEFANEHHLTIDKASFDEAMKRQKELARGSRENKNSMKSQNLEWMDFKENSEFVGYDVLKVDNAKVIKLFELGEGNMGIVTDKTPFYAEMGGEKGDVGVIFNEKFEGNVYDCIAMPNGQHLLKVQVVLGDIAVNDFVTLEVNSDLRKKIQANHTATHLLDQALKDVLGNHVYQHGSQINSVNIRFDFNHFENVSSKQLLEVESIVKEKIKLSLPVKIYEKPIEEAKKEGCIAIFGEKYGNIVRIVNISEYSKEFCGGCHVMNTADIDNFAITSIESKGSGVFRIEAVTGKDIQEKMKTNYSALFDEYKALIIKYKEVIRHAKEMQLSFIEKEMTYEDIDSYQLLLNVKKVNEELKEEIKIIEKAIKNKEDEQKLSHFDENNVTLRNLNGISLVFVELTFDDASIVKQIADNLQCKYPESLIFVMSKCKDKVLFVAKANSNLNQKGIHCGNLVKQAAILCGGNGGGRPDFAQAGGKNPDKATDVYALIEGLLS